MKIFKKLRSAFTLGELVIVMIVIGVIASIAIATTKPYNRASKYLYSRAFDSLHQAAYNVLLDSEGTIPNDPNVLCEGLTKYINSILLGTDQYCKTTTAGTRPNKETESFSGIDPAFTATNGMRFYITDQLSSNIFDNPYPAGTPRSTNVKYYIIFVDLDGAKGKGTSVWADNNDADVVAFLLTEEADVIPLGKPYIDREFAPTRVQYPPDEVNRDGRFSAEMSYAEARNIAWAGYSTKNDIRTFNYNQASVIGNKLTVTEPPLRYGPTNMPAFDATDCGDKNIFSCDIEITRFF